MYTRRCWQRVGAAAAAQLYDPGEPPFWAELPGAEAAAVGGDQSSDRCGLRWMDEGSALGMGTVQLYPVSESPLRARLETTAAVVVRPKAPPEAHVACDGWCSLRALVAALCDCWDTRTRRFIVDSSHWPLGCPQWAVGDRRSGCDAGGGVVTRSASVATLARRGGDGELRAQGRHDECGGGRCSGRPRYGCIWERRHLSELDTEARPGPPNRGGLGGQAMAATSRAVIRVGEATNPGPPDDVDLPWIPSGRPSVLQYPMPGRQGFHGVHAAGFAETLERPPSHQPFALRVATVNATSWGSLRTFLQTTGAHVVCAQEHRLPPAAIAAASAWARRKGWKSVWTAAAAGPNGGWSGGTAVMARDFIGLRHPDVGGEVVAEGHATAAVVEAPSTRPFIAYSGYLFHGQGPRKANLDLMATIGEHYEAQGDDRPPCIVAADFNMEPAVVDATSLPAAMNGRVVCPRVRRGTCRTRTSAATYDFSS